MVCSRRAGIRQVSRWHGHDLTTDAMLRDEALAYLPVRHAAPADDDHYETGFASIELLPRSE